MSLCAFSVSLCVINCCCTVDTRLFFATLKATEKNQPSFDTPAFYYYLTLCIIAAGGSGGLLFLFLHKLRSGELNIIPRSRSDQIFIKQNKHKCIRAVGTRQYYDIIKVTEKKSAVLRHACFLLLPNIMHYRGRRLRRTDFFTPSQTSS